VILSHDLRRLVHFAVTAKPMSEWTARQLLKAFPWDHAPRYLLRDPDWAYGLEFSKMTEWMSIHEVQTAPRRSRLPILHSPHTWGTLLILLIDDLGPPERSCDIKDRNHLILGSS
jgi:hypothetical protein